MRCRKSDLVVVDGNPGKCAIYRIKTHKEAQDERAADPRPWGDDGESILCSPYTTIFTELTLHVTTARAKWLHHSSRKPPHLCEGVDLATGRRYHFGIANVITNITEQDFTKDPK